MNPSIQKLHEIGSKSTKRIIGLMSGTSLDGLDIALCKISGHGTETSVSLEAFITKSYDEKTKRRLKAISSVEQASMEEVCLLHSWLGDFHGDLILEALEGWDIAPDKIDCIASHGQTIYHAPIIQHGQQDMPNSTLQIGDGDHLANKTGILTISDFRQKHTAAGGEGAPMVSLVDRILYTHENEDRILLNIGGIANFTYLPAGKNSDQDSITTDTGPGNTLIDAAAQQYFSKEFDKDSKIAKKGTVKRDALAALKSDPYFSKPLPKTTGPEVFNLNWVDKQFQQAGLDGLTPEDLVATLTRLSSETIADSIKSILDSEPLSIYVSGGGIHNPLLVQWIQELIPSSAIKNFDEIGFDPDAKEAVLFAVLANEMLSGEGFLMDPNVPNSPKVNFGKISFST